MTAEAAYSMERTLERRNLWRHVKRVIDNLTDQEIEVLRLYYFEDKTYKEVGESIGGKSGSRAGAIAAKALRKVRARLTRKGIASEEDFHPVRRKPRPAARTHGDLYERLRWRGEARHRESKESWQRILHHTYRCGTRATVLVAWDKHKGFSAVDISRKTKQEARNED